MSILSSKTTEVPITLIPWSSVPMHNSTPLSYHQCNHAVLNTQNIPINTFVETCNTKVLVANTNPNLSHDPKYITEAVN